MIKKVIDLNRSKKQVIAMLVDSVFLVLILLASFSIRLGYWYFPEDIIRWVILISPIIAIPIFIQFGLYRTVIRYIGFKTLWTGIKAVSLYALIWGIFGFMLAVDGIPRSVILINWVLSILVIVGLRLAIRWSLSEADWFKSSTRKNVAIYGAGDAGRQLLSALQQSSEYKTVAILDDAYDLQKHSINGVTVFSPKNLKTLITEKKISEILLAIPSESHARRGEILALLEKYPVVVRSLPGVAELAQGKIQVSSLKEVSIADLLGRNSVVANQNLLEINIKGKVVMVTGAGGSIGSELCRQISRLGVKKLVLFERNEHALYKIEKDLSKIDFLDVVPILGSVVNQSRIERVCKSFGVKTIYHAAAYKHVPMVEFNNTEGVNNNVFGTLNCAKAAINCGVETFVLISTDKAVRPTNTMGASKRVAELILQGLAGQQKTTTFTMVRFGNVLGSSGSVVPLFKRQIKEGGPITVTHKDIVRYFMTVPEAVELVIQAGAMGQGGDVFVLDMGKLVRIDDLARKMIHLSGLEVKDKFNPNGDIEIIYTGLRPGEKLYEELLIGGNVSDTDNPLIMRAQETMLVWGKLELILNDLQFAITDCDQKKLREQLIKLVPGFKPKSEIVDLLYSGN